MAPALPTVAWTQQGKLLNSQTNTEAKKSCNLGSNLIAQPNLSVIPPASSRGEQKLKLSGACETTIGLNVHLCNTWSSGFHLYFFTVYGVCTRAPQITIY